MSNINTAVSVVVDPNVPGRVILKNVRIAFAWLNEPQPGQISEQTGQPGPAKYGAMFLIPNDQTEAINAVMGSMWNQAVAKWQDKATGIWQGLASVGKLALRDGMTKSEYDGFPGCQFISASTPADKRPPELLSNFAGPDGAPAKLPRPQSMIYSGCYVNAQLDFWVQDNKFGKRINCEIAAVQFNRAGDSFGAGGVAANLSAFSAQPAPAGGFGAAPAGTGGFAAPQQPAQQFVPQFAQQPAQQFAPQQPQQFAPQPAQQFAPQQFAPQPAQQFPAPGQQPQQFAAPPVQQAAPQGFPAPTQGFGAAPGGWTPPGQ